MWAILMAANQVRGTPGMLLMALAVAMLIVAVWQWTQKRGRGGETGLAPSAAGEASVK